MPATTPLARAAHSIAGGAAAASDEGAPPRVLVVDDDEANRESLSRRLTRRGHVVVMAKDGLACLAAVEETDFDVVLLDVMMPGLSGLDVLTRIRQTRSPSDLPIIMATARDGSGDVVEALGLGANDYVTKPLDFPVVLARVQMQVSIRRAVQQIRALERRLAERNAALEAANEQLQRTADRTRQELALAAKLQATFLPAWQGNDVIRVGWRYEPCTALAGDGLNVCLLDEQHVAFHVLDVSGHGVSAALTAVAIARLLTPAHDPSSILVQRGPTGDPLGPATPSSVMGELVRRFKWNSDVSQFVTAFYGVLHIPTRTLTYASAGHPGPIRIRPGQPPLVLESTCLPIGIEDAPLPEQRQVTLQPGDRCYAYSDGVIEAAQPEGDHLAVPGLAALLTRVATQTLDQSLSAVMTALTDWRNGHVAKDDVTLLAIECGA